MRKVNIRNISFVVEFENISITLLERHNTVVCRIKNRSENIFLHLRKGIAQLGTLGDNTIDIVAVDDSIVICVVHHVISFSWLGDGDVLITEMNRQHSDIGYMMELVGVS